MVYHNRETPDHTKVRTPARAQGQEVLVLPATVHQRFHSGVQGWKVKTSPVPIKDPYFATLKSNNYLPNALVALDAQLEGFDQVHLAPYWALAKACN